MIVPALALRGVDKSFDGFAALKDASFAVDAGEVHALLGENGAGKSTLMNVACGLYAPDAGEVLIGGAPVRLSGPRQAAELGIGMVHQHFKLVRPFSIVDNVVLQGRGAGRRVRYGASVEAAAEAIRAQGAALGFSIDPHARVDTLSVAEQQRVEIVRALVAGARILILDEPTAVLAVSDAERLLETLRELAARGTAIVLITHKLADVRRFADRVTVMRGGRTVATVDPAKTETAELTRLTVGDAPLSMVGRSSRFGRRRFETIDLTCLRHDGAPAVDGASFHVRAGEIYGLAGVSGNGQSELAEALMGLRRVDRGAIQFEDAGQSVETASPSRLRAYGAAFIPADRYSYALAGGLSVADNYAIGRVRRGDYGPVGWTRRGTIRSDAAAAVEAFDVQGVRSLDQKAALLSGGNAQKLVIAREFGGEPTIVVAQSPSRGLDVRASAAVHGRLAEARDRGAAVLLLSEDLDEVTALADRIGVMSGGKLVAEFEVPFDRQAIGRAMVDHSAPAHDAATAP